MAQKCGTWRWGPASDSSRRVRPVVSPTHSTSPLHCPRHQPGSPPPVTQTVMLRRLRFFGHVIRSDPDEDHTRALNAGINDPPKEWRRPRGRPHQTSGVEQAMGQGAAPQISMQWGKTRPLPPTFWWHHPSLYMVQLKFGEQRICLLVNWPKQQLCDLKLIYVKDTHLADTHNRL